MNKTFWMTLAAAISTSAFADQPATNTTPHTTAHPVPARPAAAELRTVPLLPGPAIVAANHVNVRGQAKLKSEVLTRMTNGETVMVIEEVALKRSGPDEPSAWAKIVLPEKARAWVHTSYLDPATKTVTAKKLNLRGGPGENYSILGTLQKGDVVKEVETRDKWVAIEPPPGAYAFIAAQYLRQESPAIVSAETPTAVTPPPTEAATVTETPVVAANTTEQPAGGTPTMANETPTVTNATPTVVEPLVVEEAPPPPRIVQREGFVRATFSIQAPTPFQLISPDNQRPINYLYTTSTNLDLSRYKGLHIIVTGEEGLDARWKNTPIITIQRIQVLD